VPNQATNQTAANQPIPTQIGNQRGGQPLNTTYRVPHQPQPTQSANINLPTTTYLKPIRIDPPNFGGESREWPTFWAAFNLAVHSQPIQLFEKHLLLLQYITKNSAAHRAIEAYPPSNSNYQRVIDILTDRYGNPKVLQDQLQAELLHLPPVNKNGWKDLRTLQENIDRICMQLTSLRTTANDSLVTNIIKSKLPRDALLKLKEKEDNSHRAWTSTELRKGLAKFVNDQEEVEKHIRTFHPTESTRRDQPQHANDKVERNRDAYRRDEKREASRREQTQPKDTTGFYISNADPNALPTPQQQPDFPCSLCKLNGHRPSACPTYPTADQRRQQLVKQNRCLICL
jgi:hypothetical protein